MQRREIDQYLRPTGQIEVMQWTGRDTEPVPVMVPGVDTRMLYDIEVAKVAREYIASAIMQAIEDVGMPEIGDDFPDNLMGEDTQDSGHLEIVYLFADDVIAEMRKFAFMLDPQGVGRLRTSEDDEALAREERRLEGE